MDQIYVVGLKVPLALTLQELPSVFPYHLLWKVQEGGSCLSASEEEHDLSDCFGEQILGEESSL